MKINEVESSRSRHAYAYTLYVIELAIDMEENVCLDYANNSKLVIIIILQIIMNQKQEVHRNNRKKSILLGRISERSTSNS